MNNNTSLLYSILMIAPLLSPDFRENENNEEYVVDTKESVVTWKCAMQFVPANNHIGYIDISRGDLKIENGLLVGGTVEIDMNTITDDRHESDNDLVDHLKSPDFFDATKFPVSAFMITQVAKAKGENINVTGDLTIKGITHSIAFPVRLNVTSGTVTVSGKITIDRTKWDVRYGSGKFFSSLADETISDEIEINMKVVARKK